MKRPAVVVGAGLAGATAAQVLREEEFDGPIVLVGAERHAPYERPPLSKEYLRGETSFESTLVHPETFYRDADIETRFGVRATWVHPDKQMVELEGGERIPYASLLIATGGKTRRPPIPGIGLPGVYQLRTVDDAQRIRSEIAPGREAVVVGMGFIGSEVAASLRQAGVAVTAVDPLEAPLYRVLGPKVGRVLEAFHRDQRVRLLFGETVQSFDGHRRVERVVTRSGRIIECDFVVLGVGIEPVTDLVAVSGAEIENGVLVDEYARTSVPGIFAAGDVANHSDPVFGRRMRVEHWQNAIKQGKAAALNMLGKQEAYEEVHWFWSDQYEHNLQYAGFHTTWDELVVRGSLEERSFCAFYLRDGRVDAAVAIDRPRDLRRSIGLIASRAVVDPALLADEDVDLRNLALLAAGRSDTRLDAARRIAVGEVRASC